MTAFYWQYIAFTIEVADAPAAESSIVEIPVADTNSGPAAPGSKV